MHKNKLKMTKDLNIRYDTIKLPEESIGKTFSDINHTNVFLGQSPKVIAKVNKWDLIKPTSFCIPKESINKRKPQRTEWEKISANNVTGKGSISRI